MLATMSGWATTGETPTLEITATLIHPRHRSGNLGLKKHFVQITMIRD